MYIKGHKGKQVSGSNRTIRRDSSSGRFVDVDIQSPKKKPTSVTLRQIREVIRRTDAATRQK
jgi:hypothetical protein